MQPEDITNDLPGVFCRVSQMAGSFIRRQKTEDRIVVAATPRHLYDRAALLHTKPLSPALCPLPSERGSTLIISLIILILLMLLGVTAMKTSDTQFQLAGNLQFEDSAMNSTETAINAAETALANGSIAASTLNGATLDPGFTTAYVSANGPVTAGLYPVNSGVDPLALVWTGVGGNGNSYSIQITGGQNYIIELMSTNNRLAGSSQTIGGRASSGCDQVNTYRITARGTSARGATKFVQSYYSVLSC